MKSRKALLALALAGVVTVALVAGTAFAQTPPSSGQQAGANYHEFFLDRVASLLGVSRGELDDALEQARGDTADQAVQDGRLTQEQADRIKAREGIGRFGFDLGGAKRGGALRGSFMAGGQMLDAMAQALGMTPEEVLAELRAGKTLAELISGNEDAVKDALVAATESRLAQAVESGRITQEQADRILERTRNLDLSQLGPLGGRAWPGMRGDRDWSGLRERLEQFRGMRPSGGSAGFGGTAL